MTLKEVVDAYLSRQRSLGMRFESAGQLLCRFSRVMGNPKIDEVTPEAVADFLRTKGALTTTWALRYKVLTGLYRFAISRGYVDRSPLPGTLPNLPPQQTPYVYSTAELGRLLEATATLRIGHSREVPAMYRTLLLLLYGSGMRIGEALRLTLQAVDIAEQVITCAIRNSSRHALFRLAQSSPRNWPRISSAGTSSRCRVGMHRHYSLRVMVASGPIRASSHGSSMSAEPQE